MWLQAIRDGAIVLLAVEAVVIGVLLLLTLVQIRKLVRLLRDQIQPLLQDAKDTMGTVQGTSRFLSDNLVSPLIKAQSYSAGVVGAARQLLLINRRVRKAPTTDRATE